MVYRGPAARDGEPTEPEKTADGIARPLLIAIHIKGIDDAEPGIYVGVRAAIAYEAATEAGAAGPGRAGDLVVAEEDVVADGPRKRLVEAVIGHMAQKVSALVAAIRTGL